MMKFIRPLILLSLIVGGSLLWVQQARAQEDALVARGEYIVLSAGCAACHTPFKAEYNIPPDQYSIEQLNVLAMELKNAQDFENMLMAGGRVFPLGPAGFVITANLTSDEETGIGGWTDDEIKTAIRTGLRPDGRVLFPLMPYNVYNNMADDDLNAIVAYLRTVPAINNPVSREGQISTEGMQSLAFQSGITAPDKTDKGAYGGYLVTSVLACSDCHTAVDPSTGAPMMDKFLGGGQPFEGPWGIVYSGNITPDDETGIGTWTEAQIKTALLGGVRPDGRHLIVMPWEDYANLTAEDADAVVYYLRNELTAVSNEVPATSVIPEFTMMSEMPDADGSSTNLIIGIGVIVLVAAGFLIMRGRQPEQSDSPAA